MTSATSATSERGRGIFSKIAFLKSLHFKEKDELCPGFEVEIFTKSLHRGGVLINSNVNFLFQGVAQAAITTNHGYLLIPGGPGASDVYR